MMSLRGLLGSAAVCLVRENDTEWDRKISEQKLSLSRIMEMGTHQTTDPSWPLEHC